MSAPFLKLEAVSKRFGQVRALHSVTFDVAPDELVVILGPTGAGKTTLLRTVAGLEMPEGGTVWMDGQEVTSLPPSERDIALVFQNFSLYPDRTVRQNLEFPLRAPGRKLSKEEIDDRVSWAASILKITPLLDRPSTRLSGGEMQRVAIGRAIVRRPRLFLLDEPLTNLDAKLRETLRVELIDLRRKLRIPMLYVTHDQIEALSMADRIVVLSEGEILQIAPPETIYREPVSPRVARQLGYPPINLIDVQRIDGNWTTPNGTPLLPAEAAGKNERVLGIRPEDIAPAGGAIPATVRVVEDLGPSTLLLVQWAGCEVHILTPGRKQLRPGDEIFPKADPSGAILWPKTSC